MLTRCTLPAIQICIVVGCVAKLKSFQSIPCIALYALNRCKQSGRKIQQANFHTHRKKSSSFFVVVHGMFCWCRFFPLSHVHAHNLFSTGVAQARVEWKKMLAMALQKRKRNHQWNLSGKVFCTIFTSFVALFSLPLLEHPARHSAWRRK